MELKLSCVTHKTTISSKTFNCTNMELKSIIIRKLSRSNTLTSNCTNMELKLQYVDKVINGQDPSNCTNMELKRRTPHLKPDVPDNF